MPQQNTEIFTKCCKQKSKQKLNFNQQYTKKILKNPPKSLPKSENNMKKN